MDYSLLPAVNASLNATSAVLICAGVALIRRGKWRAHRACMIAAVAASTLFLVSYLTYHAHVGVVRFPAHGWIRPVYFSILTTHTILAAAIVPLVLVTLIRAFRSRFDKHRAIARWTYPAWLYVSVTGVVIYVLLYHLTAVSAIFAAAAVVLTIVALVLTFPRAAIPASRTSPDHQIIRSPDAEPSEVKAHSS